MANNRYISTNFWKDNYIVDLDPSEKLIFLYLLTNPKTNIAGIYEIHLREVAYDTGFDIDMVKKILGRFEADGKMQYTQGWLVLNNWQRHQATNPSVVSGVERILATLPAWLRESLKTDQNTGRQQIEITASPQPVDSLPTEGGHTLLNSTKTLPNPKTGSVATATEDDTKSPKVSSKDIDEIFAYWESELSYKVTARLKQNREYAGKLIKEYGVVDVKRMIHGAALAADDRFAPRVANFIDLYRKFDELKLWGKKHFQSQRSAGATVVS